jgi:tetratricopeptide (TPR) repeat protein
VAVAKALFGARNVAVVPALIDLGSAMHASRSVNDAEAVFLEGKAILDRSGDFTSQMRAHLLSSLAECLASTDVPKSLAIAEEAVAIYRKLPPSAALGGALYQAAMEHLTLGNNAAAEKNLKEAISLSKRFDGDPNSFLPRYYAYEAQAELEQMQYVAAEQSSRLALKYALAMGGEEDVDTLETESRLGMFLVHTGRSREALPYLQKAKDNCVKARGAGDPFYTPQMLLEYGMSLNANGRPEEALQYVLKQSRTDAGTDRERVIWVRCSKTRRSF